MTSAPIGQAPPPPGEGSGSHNQNTPIDRILVMLDAKKKKKADRAAKISSMTSEMKKYENMIIEGKILKKRLIREAWAENPDTSYESPSSDESLISVSEDLRDLTNKQIFKKALKLISRASPTKAVSSIHLIGPDNRLYTSRQPTSFSPSMQGLLPLGPGGG